MAEIEGGGGKKKGGGVRSKKSSTKVDMTPMVDLAFLLITFFMLTTTLNKPQALQVNMPDKNDNTEKPEIAESKAMTIILGENNKIYWYTGVKEPKVSTTDFSPEGIRYVLNKKNKEVGADLVVVIKAMKKAKYNNLVDILDEMNITHTKRFAIVDITKQDEELVKMEDEHSNAEKI
ncbi:MAG TPA: biopolymer transporter ExbD [Cytophagaceae bacterium]|jgi:biopolymer transport protein ExbD|nr:biopolymer transporter ExbD [Cytophagaceae bacterium]